MHGLLHFLSHQIEPNLIRALITTFANLFLVQVLIRLFRRRLDAVKHAWHEHRKTQETIADRLDTETPGGLGELKGLQEALRDLVAAQKALVEAEAACAPSEPQKG